MSSKFLPKISFAVMGLITLIIIVGCSGGNTTDILTPSNNNISDSQNQIYHGNTNLGEFVLTIDPDKHTAIIDPVSREASIDVTPFVRVNVLGLHWDEFKRIWDIDIEVVNPSPYTGFGPWVVFKNTGDQRILDQDGFIWWSDDGSQPPRRIPIVAFSKDRPQRMFQAMSSEYFRLKIHWPDWVDSFLPVNFFIDASFPGPRQQPIIEQLRIEPTAIPENFQLSAFVKDWQNPPPGVAPLEVWVDLRPIGGPERHHLYNDPSSDDIWLTSFMAVPPPHPVPLTVHALDWEGFHHENDVIFGHFMPPDCLPMEIIDMGAMGFFSPIEMIIRDNDTWEYMWSHLHGSSTPPIVDFKNEQIVWVDLGSRRSSGFSVNIDCVKEIGGPDGGPHTIVDYTEAIPGENCMVLWVITSPYQIVKTPLTVANDNFFHHEIVYQCPEPPECLPIRPLASGDFSNIHSPAERYIKTPDAWHAFWTEHNPNEPIPQVDWNREEVVAVNLGTRNTGEYFIEYDCISMVQDPDNTKPPYLFVEYTEMIPGEGCITPDVVTYPYNYVAIPRQNAHMVKFDHNVYEYPCEEPPACLPLRPIASGNFSNINNKREHYFKNQAEWHNFWTQHKPNAPVPQVDWNNEEVVAVTIGMRNTGGFSVNYHCISMVYDDPTVPPYLFVEYKEMIPGRGCIVPDVITYPYNFVAIPRQDAWTAKFDHGMIIYDCD